MTRGFCRGRCLASKVAVGAEKIRYSCKYRRRRRRGKSVTPACKGAAGAKKKGTHACIGAAGAKKIYGPMHAKAPQAPKSMSQMSSCGRRVPVAVWTAGLLVPSALRHPNNVCSSCWSLGNFKKMRNDGLLISRWKTSGSRPVQSNVNQRKVLI